MSRKSRLAIAFIGSVVSASACGLLPPTVYQVDPAALEEVGSIGKVKERASREVAYAGAIEISNMFVMDVGGESGKGARDRAVNLLRSKGWKVAAENLSLISMESDKWNGQLTVSSFLPFDLQRYPNTFKALESAATIPKTFILVKVNKRRSYD
ncbi:hypothetical protein [Nonomuraea turcica]|uniref:hypothetical protein n=1 Tax=Nonomuraea sp. G32 TaxID=3067274 RepID=UPI00273B122E|nr:hypothetical protein [Nonomuraea sp. G32]MDP4507057.1 hypothetical protein [Nonomuraea sp. G32]